MDRWGRKTTYLHGAFSILQTTGRAHASAPAVSGLAILPSLHAGSLLRTHTLGMPPCISAAARHACRSCSLHLLPLRPAPAGPTIRVRQGMRATINFKNNIPLPTKNSARESKLLGWCLPG